MTRYLQVSREIASDIESGVLGPGDELPSIRDAASRYKTTSSTIGRAYRHLAGSGLIEVADRRRSRVAAGGDVAARRRARHASPTITSTNLLCSVAASPGAIWRHWPQGQVGGRAYRSCWRGHCPASLSVRSSGSTCPPGPSYSTWSSGHPYRAGHLACTDQGELGQAHPLGILGQTLCLLRQGNDLSRLAGEPVQAGRRRLLGISTETLVALTAATASIPGSRPSSSAASRLSSDTNLCGPAWIST